MPNVCTLLERTHSSHRSCSWVFHDTTDLNFSSQTAGNYGLLQYNFSTSPIQDWGLKVQRPVPTVIRRRVCVCTSKLNLNQDILTIAFIACRNDLNNDKKDWTQLAEVNESASSKQESGCWQGTEPPHNVVLTCVLGVSDVSHFGDDQAPHGSITLYNSETKWPDLVQNCRAYPLSEEEKPVVKFREHYSFTAPFKEKRKKEGKYYIEIICEYITLD